MEKNVSKNIKDIIIALLLSILFVFTQFFAYFQGVIFGADNHEIVEEVKDEVFNKKESNRRYSQVGTEVPNSGYVENVYVNMALSDIEIYDLLSNIEYSEDNDDYFVFVVGEFDNALIIMRFNGNDYSLDVPFIYVILDAFYDVLYSSYNFTHQLIGEISKGWKSNFNGVIGVNSNVSNEIDDILVGNENDKLTSLFSITPFEEEEEEEKPLFFEQFIEDASNIVLGFVSILVNATVSLTDIMYNESTNQLTIVGSAFALALAVGVVYLFFRLIRGLIRSNNRG